MKLVLLSGGSGQRLWPISDSIKSKQFLPLLNRGDGVKESMLQRIWRQLEKANLQKDTYIATNQQQLNLLTNQINISMDKIIIEPMKQDTYPAILLSTMYLYNHENIDENETIIVLPVDPYTVDNFFEQLKLMENLLSYSELCLLGIKPTYPSEKYGYILPKNDMEVEKFVEKPNAEVAESLINKGAFWNAGVFAFKLKDMKAEWEKYSLLSYSDLLDKYSQLPKISFDYEFVEKKNNITYLLFDDIWKDLGTWNTLAEEMKTDNNIGIVKTINSSNVYTVNELEIPIGIIGLNDVIVAASDNGILISKLSESHNVKQLPKNFFE